MSVAMPPHGVNSSHTAARKDGGIESAEQETSSSSEARIVRQGIARLEDQLESATVTESKRFALKKELAMKRAALIRIVRCDSSV